MKYITIISLTLSILINNVFGQEEDIINTEKILQAVGNHISIIAANLKGKVDINSDILPHSNALYLSLAAIDIDKTSEGTSNTSGLKTKSLPVIWSDKKAFRESMNVSTEKAKALVIAAGRQ